ncbi:LLM class flavin-dependent oxidoreductase [Paenibacillus sp. VCA1]|uniref:LLM class flavin-dependent oxidoreductase n=1 Tax=Paenibacillus sp. VCA1 TaxID=3039148 RepID=UPI0028726702|nr:LLM class flavin-dependent oxidoreductase [Paenibacillus sp. VCA1]MDR9854869.1 LLM class flavin-dependent oxidoreductase [Paenibacillus sp. VCA1]
MEKAQVTGKQLKDVTFSVLDLAPVTVGSTPSEAFKNTMSLAQHAEAWGYHRYWLAEHHNMPGIGSSATSVVIGYVAGGTNTIRVGSGGIMLPNHSPLVIAEQFGTLEAMYPGRIDLGLGRAPGTDQVTAMALRRDVRADGSEFPEQLEQLRAYFDPNSRYKRVRAFPGEGQKVPIWLLGSSGFSSALAAKLGLPFSFASHFSPEYTIPALEQYRERFQPSEDLDRPHAMVGVNVFAADTTEEAEFIATSFQQQFLGMIRNTPGQLPPPVKSMDGLWTEQEKYIVMSRLSTAIIGNPEQVKRQLQAFLNETQADEMIVNSAIYDHQARLRSYEIVAEITGMKK